jgi:hypothetical protein
MNTWLKKFLQVFLPLSMCLIVIGFVGIFLLLQTTLPTLGPRWLLFFLGVLGLTGVGLPITYFLNGRFPSNPPADELVIIRQALWFGIFGGAIAWLQLGRVLTGGLAIILAAAFTMIEFLLRLFERSRWNPKGNS